MPRGNGKKIEQNMMQKDLFSKMMKSMYETKRVESSSTVPKAFEEAGVTNSRTFGLGETLPPLLEDVFIDVHTTFNMNHSHKSRVIMFAPPTVVDKTRIYHLPPALPNTVYRIVLITGTHEVFQSDALGKFLGKQEILVPQGHAMKISDGFDHLTYNNKGFYDKDIHPGKGFKKPEKRYILIFDFITDNPEDIEKAKAEALGKATSGLSQANGLIANLFKSIGFTKQ